MQRSSFENMACPIARSLEQVGEWWSILILRDAVAGLTRFDQFQKSLGIAPNMLTRRLASLVDAGMLERRPYSVHPPRDEYVLSERGHDFRTVLLALLAFGSRHFPAEGGGIRIVDAATGALADPILVDRRSGRPLVAPDYKLVRPGRQARAGSAVPGDASAGLLAARPWAGSSTKRRSA
ncbi:MAG: helix-turn-helix transcriptional regulator [Pseudomonadota bacterium]|nr:helix-turn-helix transcriptional regulator [Pseudomonadota bacterium]